MWASYLKKIASFILESRVPTQCYKRDLIWTILMLHSGVCCEGSLPPIDCYALVDNHIIQLPSAHSVYASYNHTIQLWTLDNKMGKMCHVYISNFSQPVGSTKQLPTFSPGNRQWEPDSTSGIDLHLLVALRNDAVIKNDTECENRCICSCENIACFTPNGKTHWWLRFMHSTLMLYVVSVWAQWVLYYCKMNEV